MSKDLFLVRHGTKRNSFSYGRSKCEGVGNTSSTARPRAFDRLLATTERVVPYRMDTEPYGRCNTKPTHSLCPSTVIYRLKELYTG